MPLLDQLRATPVQGDGVWIYPDLGSEGATCLIAWWFGDVLRDLGLVCLPAGEQRFALLQEHLTQMAWAGEIEGWLTSEPHYHLVASPETAALWQPILAHERPCDVVLPEAAAKLAARTAKRAVADDARPNLLPADYISRYKQRLIDRLWMRALGAMIALYIAGVAIYFGWTQMVRWQHDRLNDQVAALAADYETTTRLKAEVQILRDQMSLQFAALDCYKAIAEALPAEVTLRSLGFDGAKGLSLSGIATAESVPQVYSFIEKLRLAEAAGQRMFQHLSPHHRHQPRPKPARLDHSRRSLEERRPMSSFLDKLNLRPNERRLVVVVAIVVFIGLNIWLVFPVFGELGRAQQRVRDQRKLLSDFQKEVDLKPTYEKELNQLKSKGLYIPSEEVAGQLMREVQDQARASVVNLTRYDASKRSSFSTNAFFDEQSLVVSLGGTGERELIDFSTG